jgi:hypothetical protein
MCQIRIRFGARECVLAMMKKMKKLDRRENGNNLTVSTMTMTMVFVARFNDRTGRQEKNRPSALSA